VAYRDSERRTVKAIIVMNRKVLSFRRAKVPLLHSPHEGHYRFPSPTYVKFDAYPDSGRVVRPDKVPTAPGRRRQTSTRAYCVRPGEAFCFRRRDVNRPRWRCAKNHCLLPEIGILGNTQSSFRT